MLECLVAVIINCTSVPLTEYEMGVVKRTGEYCARKNMEKPCLSRFYKLDTRKYHAMCGSRADQEYVRKHGAYDYCSVKSRSK